MLCCSDLPCWNQPQSTDHLSTSPFNNSCIFVQTTDKVLSLLLRTTVQTRRPTTQLFSAVRQFTIKSVLKTFVYSFVLCAHCQNAEIATPGLIVCVSGVTDIQTRTHVNHAGQEKYMKSKIALCRFPVHYP